jgi:hypothetical protein
LGLRGRSKPRFRPLFSAQHTLKKWHVNGADGFGHRKVEMAGESMNSVLESEKNSESRQRSLENLMGDRLTVLQELENILSSPYFKSADRCKQFLRYVVQSKLDGHTERLKERIIGTDVFQRPPGYATGDDPVVRVQAGEVRRRLERYYQEATQTRSLRIELPVGSYSPVFHWGPAAAVIDAHTRPAHPAATLASPWKRSLKAAAQIAIAILAVTGCFTLLNSLRRVANPMTTLDQFWGPAIASHQPILICLANASDRPSEDIPQASPLSHSSASQTPIQAVNVSPPSNPDDNLPDSDSSVSPEIVPAADASVAVALSGLFGELNRESQLRIGAAATYEDLRNFPSVLIGGFNSKWTMQLVSNLHFAFLWSQGRYMIREQTPGGRVWTTRLGPHGETVEDYAIVGRLIDSKTGQFTITVAGIGPRGTQAAGEFVSSSRYLQEGLANAPAGWQNRNLEVLLKTTVTDSVAGPPHVIATYAW